MNDYFAAQSDMNETIKKKYEERILLFQKKFENLSEIWCEEELKQIDIEKILKTCIKELIENQDLNIKETIKTKVKELIKTLIKEKEVKHINLQIIGKTGVGKSTLVNQIFQKQLTDPKKGLPLGLSDKPSSHFSEIVSLMVSNSCLSSSFSFLSSSSSPLCSVSFSVKSIVYTKIIGNFLPS